MWWLPLLFSISSAGAATCDEVVAGVVVDGETGEPLPGAVLRVGPADDEVEVVADGEGAFRVEGQCGPYVRLTARVAGFHDALTAVEPGGGSRVQLFTHEDHEIVITEGRPLGLQSSRSTAVLEDQQLDAVRGRDLADTLRELPGVSAVGGSSASSKPVVRGQFGKRLLVLVDGLPHEGQDWGIDHAPEVDPFAASRITVIRGAAGVAYGPQAVGGVILVEPAPLRDEPGVDGVVHAVAGTNGARGAVAAQIDAASNKLPGLAARFTVSGNLSADQRAPDYVLANTAARGLNLGAMVGYEGESMHAQLSWSRYELANGVCACARHGTAEAFTAGLDSAPPGSEAWTASLGIDDPLQRVVHQRARAHVGVDVAGLGHVDATVGFQHNHRIERELVRGDAEEPQYDFVLRTTNLDVGLSHAPIAVGYDGTLEGRVGLVGELQENVYQGYPLIPNYRSISGGVYAWERLWRQHSALEIGARYDRESRAVYLSDGAWDRLGRRAIQPDCRETTSAHRCDAAFDAATASVGVLWGEPTDAFDAKVDLSSAVRSPSIDEQFIDGTAPTFPVTALGDPTLGVETTWSASFTSHLHLPAVHAEFSPYVSLVDDYIQFAPATGPDGQPLFDVLSRGTFPRFSYQADDARWRGAEALIDLAPEAPVGLRLDGSVVRGETTDGQPLAFVPPDRARATVAWRPPDVGPLHSSTVAAEVLGVRQQKRTHPGDFAPAPSGYALVGLRASTVLEHGDNETNLSLELSNLFNTRYREFTSLLRYYADEPGRDAVVRASVHFTM